MKPSSGEQQNTAAPLRAQAANWLRGGAGCALAIAMPGTAVAELDLAPYVGAQQEYHSNLFAVPENGSAGELPVSETLRRTLAGLAATFSTGPQRFQLTAEGRRVQFNEYQNLDHDEHLFTGDADWRMFGNTEGSIEARSERRMAAFNDRRSSELTMETDRSAEAGLDIGVTPTWHLLLGASGRELYSPLPQAPEFGLRENGYSAGINYVADAYITAGLEGERTNGRFQGVEGDPRYTIDTLQLTAHYAATGLSSFDGQLGYSVLHAVNDPDLEDVSGFTGLIGYNRQLTGVTDFNVQAFRRVSSYIAGANATTDVGYSTALNWKPTVNIALSGSYSWTRNLFSALATEAAVEPGREDRRQDYTLKLAYQALRWLSITGYGLHRDRDSSSELETYTETIAGLDLTLRWD